MNVTPFKLICAAGLFAIFSSTFAGAPVMYLFTGGIWPLAAIRFYHGLATAIFMPVAMAYVSDLHEGARGEKLGWFSTATLSGRFMAPLTGGVLLGYFGSGSHVGFVTIYSVCLVGGFAALAISAKMPSAASSPQNPKTWKHLREGFIQLVSSGPLLAIGLVEAGVLFMYGTVEVFLPLYGLSQGIGAFAIGVCLAAQVITLALTKPIMGKLSDPHGRSGQILWGALLGVAAAACMAAAASFVLLLALSILIGLSLSMVTSATSAAVADISRCETRGSAMGLFGTIMDVGHSAGPLASGVAASFLGLPAAFMGSAIVLALAAVSFKTVTTKQLKTCAVSGQE
jgi:MFS family permease